MKNSSKQMYELCKKHMHSYVLAETADGMKVDGIITGLDDEHVYMAVPNEAYQEVYGPMYERNEDDRFFGYPYGYGYGFPGYGYGYPPRRRFRRLVLPLAALTALSLLPWY